MSQQWDLALKPVLGTERSGTACLSLEDEQNRVTAGTSVHPRSGKSLAHREGSGEIPYKPPGHDRSTGRSH